jgi:hypothetical protein
MNIHASQLIRSALSRICDLDCFRRIESTLTCVAILSNPFGHFASSSAHSIAARPAWAQGVDFGRRRGPKATIFKIA